MGYKVFFAFQMDTEDKFGKGFIQSAIEIAIQKFKSEGVEVSLDFGFRGTPGSPLLIEEMLKKSSDSDMVIVDLTFTSSKEWFNAELIDEDINERWFSIPIGDRKLSPNPNVLLETGYAWATKGTYRTLAVMNVANGSPDELPVDLKGFRWGITYNLDESNYEDRKSIRKDLANDFYDAIKTAIASEAEYQQEKWKPIRLHKNWMQRDFTTIYRPTQAAKDIIKQLRIDLDNTEIAQRIVGPKNSGKTRLVYEMYKEIDETLPRDECLEKILYYDLDGGDYRSIESKLLDLQLLNQRKILILDNCPIKIHTKVFSEFPHDSKVSLLTIGNTEDGEGASHYIDRDFVNEVIEKLSNETGNPRNTRFILENSNGNLRNAIAMIGKIPEGDEGLSTNYQVKWRQILGVDLYSEQVLRLLEEISLFTHIGYYDRHRYQLEIILERTGIASIEALAQIIDKLSEKGIVKITGDFLMLEVFVEELAFQRLHSLATEELNAYLDLIKTFNLSRQFSDRLIELNNLEGTHKLVDVLTQDGGLLTQYEFINSNQGARLLKGLAEIEPEKVLQLLNSAIGNKSYEELKGLDIGRRDIVWALERLVYREKTFNGAATLLFKLSVAENEPISNNATFQFCQLFQCILPGTTVSLKSRLDLLDNLVEDATEPEIVIIKQALDRALMVKGFTRMGGADKQAGETLHDYHPETNEEVLNYWKEIIDFVEQLKAYEVLIRKFSSQVSNGNSLAMIQAIERMLDEKGTLDKDLRQQFAYIIEGGQGITPEIIEQVEKLSVKYSGSTIREKLEYNVALAPYSTSKGANGEFINKSEEKANEFAAELINSQNKDWLNHIDILLQNEQRFTFGFGKKVAELQPGFERLVQATIEKLSQIPVEKQNNSLIEGYLAGIEETEFKRKTIDLYLSRHEIAHHAIRMTKLLEIEISDLQKLYELIEANPKYTAGLQYINLTSLPEEEFIEFINRIKEIEPYGWWLAIDFCQTRVGDMDTLSVPILKLVRGLLMKEGILTGNNAYTLFPMHKFVELFKEYKKNNFDGELAVFLAKKIVEVSKESSLFQDYSFQYILDVLFDEKWNETWPVISTNILKKDYYGWYNLKDLLKRYKRFDDKKLLEWMNKFPTEAPQKAIGFIQLMVNPEGEEEWSPLTLEMFDRYHENEDFLSELSSDLHSYSWSGSLVPLLESRKRLVEQLLEHPKEEIRKFAKANADYFENWIKREKRSDQNYRLDI
ncbi:hypothetical protein [Lewinella sp. LCG006]|uniref:hypothetical protein n=1 Tax=Lewinella sp. LCG006 TaxID=3231911 RepID=UPI0034612AFE